MEDVKADPRYEEARRHARNVRGFYTHLAVYVLVNAGLFALNMLSSPGRMWFGWTTFGWGIGLVAHSLAVFGLGGWLGQDWEDREIRRRLDKKD